MIEEEIRRLALERAERAVERGESTFTDFLDPNRAQIITNTVNKHYELSIKAFGGFLSAQRCLIQFYLYDESPFPIDLVVLDYDQKFQSPPGHRDVMGSVLGLGLERDKIGDIVVNDRAYIYCHNSVSGYISSNLSQVGRNKVKPSIIPLQEPGVGDEPSPLRLIVSSMRLDAVISEGFRLSRAKAAELIRQDRVFVNWQNCDKRDKTLSEGDVISLRGSGRLQLVEISGKTKKDRIVIDALKY